MNGYSTREAAQRLGLSLISLKRYVAAGKIPTPSLSKVGGVSVRLWSDEDIQRVKETLPKIANGRKTRHQREKQKRQKKKRPKQ